MKGDEWLKAELFIDSIIDTHKGDIFNVVKKEFPDLPPEILLEMIMVATGGDAIEVD